MVTSAGFLEDGRQVPPEVAAVMGGRGLDMTGHRSTRVSAGLIEEADIVVGMTRRHVRDASVLVPARWDRMFTLRELVRLAEAAPQPQPGKSPVEQIEQVARGRVRADLVGRAPADDVADPYGGPLAGYRATADELWDLVDRLIVALCGTAARRDRVAPA